VAEDTSKVPVKLVAFKLFTVISLAAKSPLASRTTSASAVFADADTRLRVGFPAIPSPLVTDNTLAPDDTSTSLAATVPAPVLAIRPEFAS
jgi:hypothetical protein